MRQRNPQSCRLAMILILSVIAFRAQAQTPTPDGRYSRVVVEADELDVWRGSSLGIQIRTEDNQPTVHAVYPHVQASSPFVEGDQLVSIGSFVFEGNPLSGLSDLLRETAPDTELEAHVIRDGQPLQLNTVTFRKELLDIPSIHRHLSSNPVIQEHLEKHGRSDFFDEMTERMAASVRESHSPREAVEGLNRLVDQLGISHTAIIPLETGFSLSENVHGQLGILLQRQTFDDRTGYFVVDMQPGSSGYESKLVTGDEIIRVNGVPTWKSKRLAPSGHEDHYHLFTLTAEMGEQVELEYFSSPFEDSQTVTVEAKSEPSYVDSMRSSAKTFQVSGARIGYVRFWNLMSMRVAREFSRELEEDFSDCDAIVMDLRGRGGLVSVVESLNRKVSKCGKPVVVIIDRLTRSAKEMLAFLLKKQDHVVVVGQKTAGAVTGAIVEKLPSGNQLMVPVVSADSLSGFIDGQILEGKGVEPDEEVDYVIPWSGGNDRMIEYAKNRAVKMLRAAPVPVSTGTR